MLESYYKTFVSLGNANNPFDRLLNLIKENLCLLPKPILIQCGHTIFECKECHIVDFISMEEFVEHISKVEVLILHAGAGSVLNAIRSDKLALVMPRRSKYKEHINDHQVDFANTLHNSGKVFIVESASDLKLGLKKIKEKSSTDHSVLDKHAYNIITKRLEEIIY